MNFRRVIGNFTKPFRKSRNFQPFLSKGLYNIVSICNSGSSYRVSDRSIDLSIYTYRSFALNVPPQLMYHGYINWKQVPVNVP